MLPYIGLGYAYSECALPYIVLGYAYSECVRPYISYIKIKNYEGCFVAFFMGNKKRGG